MTAPFEFRLPDVGEGIAQIEVLRWFAEVGETVHADQPLIEGETDKSVVEIPSPVTGTLLAQCIAAGTVGAVGELLAVIASADSPADAVSSAAESFMTPPPAAPPPAPSGEAAPGSSRRRPLASPHTRRLAAQRGIDLTTVAGTGPHGRITEADLATAGAVSAAAPISRAPTSAAPPLAAPAGATPPTAAPRSAASDRGSRPRTSTTTPLTGVRRATAQAMTAALRIPHITEFREVDATNLLAARAVLAQHLADRGLHLSVLPLLLAAVARALAGNPSFNATFDERAEAVTSYSAVDLGIATATDDGLLVPVLRDADQRGLADIAAELDRLAAGARARTLGREELTGGTFTVTNIGSFGSWLGTPLIRPPEVGIAGFGRIADRVIVVDGQPAVRPVLPIIAAADHRIHDGSHLAAFIDSLAEVVAQPLVLLA